MSKFLLPILAGIAMVIVSGCGGAGAPATDGTDGDGETKSAGLTPEQIEAQRLINEQLKAEITACGGTCAGYAEWLTANPNLPTIPIEEANHATTNNTGYYLQATATGLNVGDVEDAVVTTVTFMDVAKSDNAFKDDDDNPFDGFAYFDGVEKRRYVGILSDTNMGAPLTTTVGRSIWQGFISSGEGILNEGAAFTTPTAFNLMVNFNATGGTIAGFIPTSLAQIAFRIDGAFDAGGVITGTTSRRVYMDKTDVSTYDASSRVNTVGTLRGLIGSDGAVGVFTTDAEDAFVPYAGGFVAKFAPLLPSSNHTLYVSAFSPPLAAENLAQNTENTFEIAQPTAEGFSATGLRFGERAGRNPDCNTCVNNFIVRLGGDNTDIDDTDGFALIYGRFTNGTSARLRAGLLPKTDLGAFLGNTAPDGAATASWPGTIYHLRQLSGAKPNQVLTPFIVAFAVDFAAGTFELPSTVLVPTTPDRVNTIRVAGRFGSHVEAVNGAATPTRLPVGVLGGNAYHKTGFNNEVPHALQGLIGAEGAVGVFISSTSDSIFGGFVARNAPVPVNHAGYISQNSDLQTEGNGTADFVQGLENGLDVTNVNFAAVGSDGTASSCASLGGCIDNYPVRLGGNNADTTDPSGFALFFGNGDATDGVGNRIYRVGLLSGTDVGVALPLLAPDGTATALWSGKVHTTVDSTGGTITPHNLTLTVNYTARTIVTATSNSVAISDGNLSINGGYGITGVMSGTATFDSTDNNADRNFNLRGVIGTQGAIGIFESEGSSHVGGFIVKPSQ